MPNPNDEATNLYQFRCTEMGHTKCKWEASGQSEDEVIHQVEQHGLERHLIGQFTPEMKTRAYRLIRRVKAA